MYVPSFLDDSAHSNHNKEAVIQEVCSLCDLIKLDLLITGSCLFLTAHCSLHSFTGSVVISAITSCTNTSNPSVMLGAGLLAKNAVNKGLTVAPYIKTSLSPGSGVVTYYLKESGVIPYLEKLG